MARWFLDRFAQEGIPSVSLRRLLPGALFVGCPDLVVSGCSADSRRIEPGEVFIARTVPESGGPDELEVARALERGASGVVLERLCLTAGPIQVIVNDPDAAHSRLCQALVGEPSRRIPLTAVAGKTGADVVIAYLKAIFEAAGKRAGHVLPGQWSDGRTTLPTTPGPWKPEVWAGMLERMAAEECEAGFLFVDRETLARKLLSGVVMESVVLTRLFHEPPSSDDELVSERRKHAKLFRMLSPEGTAVVNADDPTCDLLGAVNLDGACVSFGMRNAADISARIDSATPAGAEIRIFGLDREASARVHLLGGHNVSHALAAASAAHAQGIRADQIVAGIESVTALPGKLEDLARDLEFEVRLDSAASPLELKIALETMKRLVPGKVISILCDRGCESREERRALAQVAERSSDSVYITGSRHNQADAPVVLEELLSGFERPGRAKVMPTRRGAIESALAKAGEGDAIVIIGPPTVAEPGRAESIVGLSDRTVVEHWINGSDIARRRTSA